MSVSTIQGRATMRPKSIQRAPGRNSDGAEPDNVVSGLRLLAKDAVARHDENAIAAERVLRQVSPEERAELSRIGATRLVELARWEANETIKYPPAPDPMKQGEPLPGDLAGRTAVMASSILDWIIDGKRLAEMTCGELAALANTHADIALGHAVNAKFFAKLAKLGDDDEEVGTLLTPAKADKLWKSCQ